MSSVFDFPTVLATTNAGKATEWDRIARGLQSKSGFPEFTVLAQKPLLFELQTMKADLVAVAKATDAYNLLNQRSVLVEDVGFGLVARDGYPGPMYSLAEKHLGIPGILGMLRPGDTRKAIVTMTIGFVLPSDPSQVCVVRHDLEGTVPLEPRGENGFGWDPIFEVEGRTFAEMQTDDKIALMRGSAIQKLLDGKWKTYPRGWRGE